MRQKLKNQAITPHTTNNSIVTMYRGGLLYNKASYTTGNNGCLDTQYKYCNL